MATQQTAQVYIKNVTDGTAFIQLFHQNNSNGTQNASWIAAPGTKVGPLNVRFVTGAHTGDILDWWAVVISIQGGSTPGTYQNTGTAVAIGWKECQLQHADAGKQMTFLVDTSTFAVKLESGGCDDTMRRLGNFDKITNVFVVMLENHSFDNMFGQSGIPGIHHAPPGSANSYGGVTYPVGGGAPLSMPTDPGHEFVDTLEQLAGPGATYPPGGAYPPINNQGYAANYATTTTEGPTPSGADIGDIMRGFDTPNQLPIIYGLATEYALCDHWFSSLPGPTWPNRFFLHGASSAGLDHSPTTAQISTWESVAGFTYPNGSLFDALNHAGLGWRLYNDNTNAYTDDPGGGSALGAVAHVSSLRGITLVDVQSLTHFATDLQAPYPYHYTFIEPNYGDITANTYVGGSSQHPMDDVYGGEHLIKAVYEAIRAAPIWNTSVLIITYDEHGGFYDSAIPAAAPAPGDGSTSQYNQSGFTFEQYGVRVPAVVVSPWIPKGTVDHTLYDHASVAKTLEELFGFASLTHRDAGANDIRSLLSESSPRGDTPAALADPAPPRARTAPTPEELAAEDAAPLDRRGNVPGFLGAALHTEIALEAQTEAQRHALIADYAQISTRGEARRRIAQVVAKADIAKSGGLRPAGAAVPAPGGPAPGAGAGGAPAPGAAGPDPA